LGAQFEFWLAPGSRCHVLTFQSFYGKDWCVFRIKMHCSNDFMDQMLKTVAENTPGPGDYEAEQARLALETHAGVALPKSERFKEVVVEETPVVVVDGEARCDGLYSPAKVDPGIGFFCRTCCGRPTEATAHVHEATT
jgi:hypothetical protein